MTFDDLAAIATRLAEEVLLLDAMTIEQGVTSDGIAVLPDARQAAEELPELLRRHDITQARPNRAEAARYRAALERIRDYHALNATYKAAWIESVRIAREALGSGDD